MSTNDANDPVLPRLEYEDYWQEVKLLYPLFRPQPIDEIALRSNEQDIEAHRQDYTSRLLVQYFGKQGYSIHPHSNPALKSVFTVLGDPRDRRIAFPRYIMTPRSVDNHNPFLELRPDIPILYTLHGFAHEAAHLDRYNRYPAVREVMEQMMANPAYGSITDLRKDRFGRYLDPLLQEESEVDVDAYFLLSDTLGMSVHPANYCTFVGRSYEYEEDVYKKINIGLGGSP